VESEAGRLNDRVIQFYEKKGDDAINAYKQWVRYYGEVTDYKRWKSSLNDPLQRPFIMWLTDKMVEQWNTNASFTGSKLVQDLLPARGDKLTADRALNIYLTMLQRNRDRYIPKLKGLENTITLPDFARAYAEKMAEASWLLMIYDTYIRFNAPKDIQEADNRAGDIADQLKQLWPNWGKAEEAAYWKSHDEARMRGDPVERPSRGWLITINIVIVVALILIIAITRLRRHRFS
jgi:hypothetical protein